jgi:AbrB family transcriptional regulator (stage V sporulation protein T)
MKATGIVRRIDDLGRVVIPKELRRTMRIREGEPLEIYTDTNGELILRKYSPVGEISHSSMECAEAIHQITKHTCLITDKDKVVACSGINKKEYTDKPISKEVEDLLSSRKSRTLNRDDVKIPITSNDTKEHFSQVFAPILVYGDAMGVIIITNDENSDKSMTESDMGIASMAALFFGKQME